MRDQFTISQTVCFYLLPETLWLTWATMCTYRVQTFNFFKTGTISIILNAFENWKFKQSLIARWMTWQDFPLKRKLYFLYLFRCWKQVFNAKCTVMILSFRTDMPGQTVQTQIRLLLQVYTVCHSVCIVWTLYSMVKPHSSNFRVITTNFLGVRKFRKFTVTLYGLWWGRIDLLYWSSVQ